MKIQEKIVSIEKEIRETSYHKGTERHIGRLKARLAKLRSLLYEQKVKGKGGGKDYAVRKTGDGTVVLVGPPSVGKSTLLNALTSAKSKVAEYEFTTLKVIPGIMNYNGARIQILDVPGLVTGAARGVGRGKEVLSVARIADLILLMTDVGRISRFVKMQKELDSAGVRLNQSPPSLTVKKRARGGLIISSPSLLHMSRETVKDICREFKLVNAEITIEEDIIVDRFVDALAGNRVYVRALSIINKIDKARNSTPNHSGVTPKGSEQELVIGNLGKIIKISAREGMNLDQLKEAIWEELDLIRIYLKSDGGDADYKEPLILKRGITVKNAAEKLSTDLAQEIKGAKIWGKRAIFSGQMVGLNYRLWDEAIVCFIS